MINIYETLHKMKRSARMDGANFGSFLAWKSINVKVRNYKPEVSDSILRSNLS